MGIKMQQKLFNWFLLSLVIYLTGFDLFNTSYFSKISNHLDILWSGPPWSKYYDLYVSEGRANFKELLPVAASVIECLWLRILDS